MKIIHVELAFAQPILGTSSADPAIHERFIASKAPDAPSTKEEIEALGAEAIIERGMTVFPRTPDGDPMLWDYMLKGFFKDACKGMRDADGSESANLAAYKSKIDTLIFVAPRAIVLHMPEGSTVRVLQRPLRAETAQGPRVALASSEMLDAGTTCEFDVTLLAEATKGSKTRKGVSLVKCLVEWFAYGRLRGIGQWRNAGYGSFHCRLTDAKTGEVLLDNMPRDRAAA